MDDIYENLANAIVIQAFDDYTPACVKVRKRTIMVAQAKERYEATKAEYDGIEALHEAAKKKLQKAETKLHRQEGLLITAEAEKKSIEDFFSSPWYHMLTKVDGEVILKEAKKRANERLEGMA